MNSRGCYCALWEKNADVLRSRGLSPGFCGNCERCGGPGHTRHFPGAVPYTGAWCDLHYRRLALLHPFAFPGTLLWLLTLGAALTLILVLRQG